MKRLDLDDLPPKIAALLSSVEAGEELVLVQAGAVVARLSAVGPAARPTEPSPPPEEDIKQVFDDFRAAIEEEF
jgi:antitoxin (DNA-binding transcriptional repressor) of toxin-antitoxin stability system